MSNLLIHFSDSITYKQLKNLKLYMKEKFLSLPETISIKTQSL